jgi:hypothetical protein
MEEFFRNLIVKYYEMIWWALMSWDEKYGPF